MIIMGISLLYYYHIDSICPMVVDLSGQGLSCWGLFLDTFVNIFWRSGGYLGALGMWDLFLFFLWHRSWLCLLAPLWQWVVESKLSSYIQAWLGLGVGDVWNLDFLQSLLIRWLLGCDFSCSYVGWLLYLSLLLFICPWYHVLGFVVGDKMYLCSYVRLDLFPFELCFREMG